MKNWYDWQYERNRRAFIRGLLVGIAIGAGIVCAVWMWL